MKKCEENKGITLIALVVTIVILIILASISIGVISGERGIIKRAQEAKELHENAVIQEEISLNELVQEYNNNISDVDSNNTSTIKKEVAIRFKDYEMPDGTRQIEPSHPTPMAAEVINLPERGYFRVGEECLIKVTVECETFNNKYEIRVTAATPGLNTVDGENAITYTDTIEYGETKEYMYSYVVTRGDLLDRGFNIAFEGSYIDISDGLEVEVDQVDGIFTTGTIPAGTQG